MKTAPWGTGTAVMIGPACEVYHVAGLADTSCGLEIDLTEVHFVAARRVHPGMRCQRSGCKEHWPEYEPPSASAKRKGKV